MINLEAVHGLGFEVARFGDVAVLGHGGSDWSEQSLAYAYQPSGDGVIIFINAPNRQALGALQRTDKSHAFERETAVDAKPVTGSESKVDTVVGAQATRIGGDNVKAFRQKVKRIS